MWLSRARALSVPLFAHALFACGGASPAPASVASAPAATGSSATSPPRVTTRATPPLVSRRVFFKPMLRSDVKVSPDGKRIGWLAPVEGIVNVWIGPADDIKKAQPVTHNTSDDVHAWWWTFASDRVLVTQDKDGDENWHLIEVDIAKKEAKDLTAVDGVRAELVKLSPKRPREALVGINLRDKKARDVFLVDLTTGGRKLAQQNDGRTVKWIADDDLRVRYAERQNTDGSIDLVAPRGNATKVFSHVPMEDTLGLEAVDFDSTGNALLLKDGRNRDTVGLFAVDTNTGAATLLADDPQTDIGPALIHPTTKTVEAVSFNRERPTWKVVDASVEGDFYYLQTFGDGTLIVTSRSLDEQRWIVGYTHPDGPTRYYRYDRDPDIPGNPGNATLLFTDRDDLDGVKLSTMNPVVIKSRDGLDLVSYITIPTDRDPRSEGRPKEPLPMVLLVHDGPWARASLDFNAEQQWLVSRGYVALTVNYRGSTGFGRKFSDAGNLEWGGKMSDDLVDAVRWAVDQKIADPAHVGIMGVGYGGYAALAGMAMSPDTFACGVDFGGPANLATFLQTLPPDAANPVEPLLHRIGDYRTDDGKKLLADRSPSTHAGAIKGPLLIGQGKDDRHVKEADTAQFVASLQSRKAQVTYAVYADEEGRLTDPANLISFGAIAEVFFAQCLGGAYHAIGNDLTGSTIAVPVGAEWISGSRSAVATKKP